MKKLLTLLFQLLFVVILVAQSNSDTIPQPMDRDTIQQIDSTSLNEVKDSLQTSELFKDQSKLSNKVSEKSETWDTKYDPISVKITDNFIEQSIKAKREAFLFKLEFLLKNAQEQKMQVSNIVVNVHLKEKENKLKKTAIDSLLCEQASLIYKKSTNALTDTLNFTGKDYFISNKWDLVLYEMAFLQEKTKTLAENLGNPNIEFRILPGSRMNNFENRLLLRPELELTIPQGELKRRLIEKQFWITYNHYLDSVFHNTEFTTYENLSSTTEHEGKLHKAIFQFSNYDTKYDNLEDNKLLDDQISPILDWIRRHKKIVRVQYQTNTSETLAFSENISGEEYDGNPLTIRYKSHYKEENQESTIKPGNITIFQQELLKLYKIERSLNIPASEQPSLELNYDQKIDDLETKIIITFK